MFTVYYAIFRESFYGKFFKKEEHLTNRDPLTYTKDLSLIALSHYIMVHSHVRLLSYLVLTSHFHFPFFHFYN